MSWLPLYFCRKKQFKKIKQLKEILHLSTDELQSLADISPYDLISWNRKEISMKEDKWYLLEEAIEDRYFSVLKKKYRKEYFEN